VAGSGFVEVGVGLLGDVLPLRVDEQIAGSHFLEVVAHQEHRPQSLPQESHRNGPAS
jgi:hypothetical protein